MRRGGRLCVGLALWAAVAACNSGAPAGGVPGAPYGTPGVPAPYGSPGVPAPYGAPGMPTPYGTPGVPAPYAVPGVPAVPMPPAAPGLPPGFPSAPAIPAAPVVPAPAAPGLPSAAVPASFGVPECDHYAAAACGCASEVARSSLCMAATMAFPAWSRAVQVSPLARAAITQGCLQAEAGIASQCGGAAAGGPATPVAPAWDGQSTFDCGGNQTVRLSGMTVTLTASPAIRAGGNCTLQLADMDVSAPVVLWAAGNANVTITGGRLNGAEQAVSATGNAHVTMTGTTVTGAVQRRGNAQIAGP